MKKAFAVSVGLLLSVAAASVCSAQQPTLGANIPLVGDKTVPLGKVRAQTMNFKAYVPFPFMVENQAFPAGVYQVQRLIGRPAETDEIGVILVRGTDRYVYKTVVTNLAWHAMASGGSAQLVFARHAGQRYLSELRIAGEKGQEIPNVASESQLVEFDLIECVGTGV